MAFRQKFWTACASRDGSAITNRELSRSMLSSTLMVRLVGRISSTGFESGGDPREPLSSAISLKHSRDVLQVLREVERDAVDREEPEI